MTRVTELRRGFRGISCGSMIFVITLLLRYFRNVLRACRRGSRRHRLSWIKLCSAHATTSLSLLAERVATLFFFDEMRMVKTVMGVNTPVLV